jgi:polar amino acid transport system permease protein
MVEFTLWDIVRNLLLAARWTVGLSLVAFVGGGLLGLALLLWRQRPGRAPRRLVATYVQVFQGTPLLMQLFLAYFGMACWASRPRPGWPRAGADALHQRLPDRDLARLRAGHAARPVGGRRAWP